MKKKKREEQKPAPPRDAPEPVPTPADVPPDPCSATRFAEQRQKLAEFEDRYRRAMADLANLHKRHQRERERLAKLAVGGLVAKLLPMIDNLGHSLKSADESHDPAALIKGFRLIETQMLQILSDSGIQPIESVGKPFDPEVHHAVTADVTDAVPPGTVTEELGRGFILDDFVIRPAQVKVAAAPEPPPDEAPEAPEEE